MLSMRKLPPIRTSSLTLIFKVTTATTMFEDADACRNVLPCCVRCTGGGVSVAVRLCPLLSGMGDMAVSNSIGSNIFDILLGLGFPWALRTLIVDRGIAVGARQRAAILAEGPDRPQASGQRAGRHTVYVYVLCTVNVRHRTCFQPFFCIWKTVNIQGFVCYRL